MKYKKVVLDGDNGYLGRVFARHYAPITEEVIVFGGWMVHFCDCLIW